MIIDMQAGSFRPYESRHDTAGVIRRINSLAGKFRSNGDKVIFVCHDGSEKGSFIPGTPDWQILPELEKNENDLIIAKTANDPFYRSELEAVLSGQNIKSLFITGCATDFCIDSAVKSALHRDYEVTAVSDGHTTADRDHAEARSIMAYYNWLWSEMIPTRNAIRVLSTEDCMTELDNESK